MAYNASLDHATDWRMAFRKSRALDPDFFSGFEVGDVPLPMRRFDGCIIYDSRGRYWLCEVVAQPRPSGGTQKLLSPIYGPFDGFPTHKPDCPYERAITEALSTRKTRSKAA